MSDDDRPETTSHPRSTEAVSLCHMQDVFADPGCRALLAALQDRGSSDSIRALTDRVAASRPGHVTESQSTDSHTGRLRMCLLAMVRLEILEYDPAADAVWIPEDVALSVRPPGARVAHSPGETDDEKIVPSR